MTAIFLGLFLACGDKDGDSSEENPYADTPATFTEVESELLMKSCAFSSCHGDGGAAGGFILEQGENYDRLVDVQSVATGETLVIPNDADGSYLLKKVIGAEGITGDLMAPDGAGISILQEQMLRSWIEAGAQDN